MVKLPFTRSSENLLELSSLSNGCWKRKKDGAKPESPKTRVVGEALLK